MTLSQWQIKRTKDKAKMRYPTAPKGWIRRWRRSLERIRDNATGLWDDRATYRAYVNVIRRNPNLDKRNEFFAFCDRVYASHMLVGLRTFDDTDLRSHSLYNLVEEIHDHPHIITRDWFVRGYRNPAFTQCGHQDYTAMWGSGRHLPVRLLKRDLRNIKATCAHARGVVNKWIAHSSRRRQRPRLTHRDIDHMLDSVYEIMTRYHLLLFRASWGGSAKPRWTDIFDVPWNTTPQNGCAGQ